VKKQAIGTIHPDMALGYHNMASLEIYASNYDTAKQHAVKAFDIYKVGS